jgi:hypothetical protein
MVGVVHYLSKKKEDKASKLLIVITMLSLVVLLTGFAFNNLAKSNGDICDYVIVEVRAGDSVWGCVSSVYGEGYDIRNVVARTLELNKIENGLVYPGTRLAIPMENAKLASESLTMVR